MKCDKCIHQSMCGCMMNDCIHHPNIETYAMTAMTNTFSDRFVCEDDENTWKHKKDDRR